MAPTPTPTPVASSLKESDTLSWVSAGLGLTLCVTLVIILGMSLRIRDYIAEKQEQDEKVKQCQDALQHSESNRKGLQREMHLLSRELENWQTLYAECWDEMTVIGAFCRENHSRHSSTQVSCSTQTEGPDGDGPESRTEMVRIGQVEREDPNRTSFANRDAAHHDVDGHWQVPRQIKFGDRSTVDLKLDNEQIDSVSRASVQEPCDPNRDPNAPNNAHAGHGQRE